jgi:hypothetical protein
MTDTELGKLVNAAFDETDFVVTIRGRLRDAVAAVIGDSAAEAEMQAGRVAADELAGVLVARQRKTSVRALGPSGTRSVPQPAPSAELERRAAAFRRMAGVRV